MGRLHSTYGEQVRRGAALTVVALAVAGCAVGPDFRQPAVPGQAGYTAATLPTETAAAPGGTGEAQRMVSGGEIPAQWWTLFRSEPLDRLIRQALAQSPTLEAARAALQQVRENRRAQVGTLFPRVDADASVERQKISGAATGQPHANFSPFTLYNASIRVSYAFDLFGGARRELEALQAQVEFQRFQMEGAYLALTANVVTAAVREASLRAQLRASQEILQVQEQLLALVESQLRYGAVSEADLLAQRTQVAQSRATLPPLEKELSQVRHLLALLAGKFPSEAAGVPQFELEGFQLPRELPVSLPSALVRQRPDIRAAEEQLHGASAQVGVATANLYPQLTLTGSYGSTATVPGDLFGGGTAVWNLGAGLLQPLFRGGELTARRRAALAAYDQAMAQYRATVLQAFQEVADVLRALDEDAKALAAQADAAEAARASLELTEKQFGFGAVNYLSLLNSQRQYQSARISLVQAQAARFADSAALFQALGGGWWNRPPEGEAAKSDRHGD